jgi:hypothetical protein
MRPFIEAIGEATDSFVLCYPNAGWKFKYLSQMLNVIVGYQSYEWYFLQVIFELGFGLANENL